MVDSIGDGTKFGRYALLDKIGTGGMAEIFRAKTFGAAGFEKEFAVKLILPSLVDDEEFVEMFINEAKIAVSLYHANIVQVFDLGEIDEQYYIAMEYVLGKDLLDVLARCASRGLKIPLNLVLFVTMEMLKGLDFAHHATDPFGEELDIIHRDVSPSNIMISYSGDVKVGDFGVAKAAIERTLTESGTLKGKVGYMSPEQVMGDDIDARSDVFAAGVVFFEALSMSRLFVGDSDLNVMLKVRDADIADKLAQAEPLPAGLRRIVERALTKHPEERFQTSGDFYQALVDFTYRHSIKVTGADLSNYMRRLFSEEIEAEKARRREDLSVQQIIDAASEISEASSSTEASDAEVSDEISVSRAGYVGQSSVGWSSVDADSNVVSASKAIFRYRDADGLIFGPLNRGELVAMVTDQIDAGGDEVSVNGGPWKGLAEIDALDGVVDFTGPTARAAPIPRAETLQAPQPAQTPDLAQAISDPSADNDHTSLADDHTSLAEDQHIARQIENAVDALEPADAERTEADSVEADSGDETSPETIEFEPDQEALGDKTSADDQPAGAALVGPASQALTADNADASVADLRDQYASYQGQLAEVPFARILARLHRHDATGRLHVTDGSTDKSIFLRDGEPVLVDSNREDELLGAFLIRRGRIDQAQLDDALTRLSEWGGRLGDALVAIGAIDAHEIFELLSEQMREKLLDVFCWADGHYGYYENQEPDTLGYPLGIDTYTIVVQACRDEIGCDQIEAFYEGRRNVQIFRADQSPVSLDELQLSTRELRVTNQFVDGTNLGQLLADLDGARQELVLRTIYLLHQVEVLAFETTQVIDLPDG